MTDPKLRPQVVPGDNVELAVTLHTDIALEVGSRFTLREGGKTSAFSLSTLQRANIDIL